jgi:hypothetical protein
MIVTSKEGMEYAIGKFKETGYIDGFFVERPCHHNGDDVERLKTAINTLGVIHEIHKANLLLEETESKMRVDVEIFHIVLDKVLNSYSEFTEEHRKRFFMENKKLEEVRRIVSRLSHADFYFPSEVEYLVIGTSREEVETLKNGFMDESFQDIFNDHLTYFNNGFMDYEKFIGSVKDWLKMIRMSKDVSKVA